MKKTYNVKLETVETVVRTNNCKIEASCAHEAYALVRNAIDSGMSAIAELPIEEGKINRVVQIDDYLIGNSGGTDGFTASDTKSVPSITFEDSGYTYNENILSNEFDKDSQRGMLEDFGIDLVQVEKINETKPNTIWRVIDGDNDRIYVKAGKGTGRVIHYIISDKEWEDDDEIYFLHDKIDNGEE